MVPVPPAPAPHPEPPKYPEGPLANRAWFNPHMFDPIEEKKWNIVHEGAIPYNGSAPVGCLLAACCAQGLCAPRCGM